MVTALNWIVLPAIDGVKLLLNGSFKSRVVLLDPDVLLEIQVSMTEKMNFFSYICLERCPNLQPLSHLIHDSQTSRIDY